MAQKRRTSEQRLADYTRIYNQVKKYVKPGTFVPPSKFKTTWHETKLMKYAEKIADLKGQSSVFAQPRKPERVRGLKKEFGGSELPGLKGGFVPAFGFDDKVRIRYDKKGRVLNHTIKHRGENFSYKFFPIDFARAETENDVRRDLRNVLKKTAKEGADAYRVRMGDYDSRFSVFDTQREHEEKLFEYVVDLMERYSPVNDDGAPAPGHFQNWLFGVVAFKANEAALPQRFRSARKRKSEQTRQRRAKNLESRLKK